MKPKLIHPVEVTIYRIDRVATQFDPDFREPIGDVKYESTPVTVKAQVKYDRFQALNMVPGGDSPQTSGYLLIENEPPGGLNKGDKIASIAGVPVELYITEKRPAVHYRGQARMLKILFEAGARG
jgi:hypothetical protein